MDAARKSAIPGSLRHVPGRSGKAIAESWAGLDEAELTALVDSGLSIAEADLLIENVIGRYSLPFAVATNFRINGRDTLVPMVIEEASAVAGCSYAAKLFRQGGGFSASADDSIMIGQIQLLDLPDMEKAIETIMSRKREILQKANEVGGSIIARGGGALDLEAWADIEIQRLATC